MDVLCLTDPTTGSSAKIASDFGFNCFEFRTAVEGRSVDVLDVVPEFLSGKARPSSSGIPLLFPFPNRIRDGKYTWDGKDYEIPESLAPYDGNGNAIHGFCLDRPWRVVEHEETFAVGRFQLSVDAPDRLPLWPTDFVIDVRYELAGSSLHTGIEISNPTDDPLPWGFGTHPYFRLPLGAKSEPQHCLVVAPATEEWQLIDCLPTGERIPIRPEKDLRDGKYFGTGQLDDVLTGLELRGEVLECAIIDEAAGLQIVQRAGNSVYCELVVYTPPGRNSVCLEPYTCLTDAINLQAKGVDAGWHVLQPGEKHRSWIEISAELVVA